MKFWFDRVWKALCDNLRKRPPKDLIVGVSGEATHGWRGEELAEKEVGGQWVRRIEEAGIFNLDLDFYKRK